MTTLRKGRTVAIIQTRMSSTRLPCKTLAMIAGKPMLERLLNRVTSARQVDQFIVATTKLFQDDPIETLAKRMGIVCFRGSENDCLDRCYQAAKSLSADVIVRLTGDNPLVDGQFIDWVVEQFICADPTYDYIDTHKSGTFPVGLSVEVFSFCALEIAWQEDTNIFWREHVTPYILHHRERFRVGDLRNKKNLGQLRWTVDTHEDLELIQLIFEHFQRDTFSWYEVVELLNSKPEWVVINRDIHQYYP